VFYENKRRVFNIFNGAQGRILYVLWEHGTLTITEIGKLTSLAKTTLTSMLDRMEVSGLIERIPDIKNRRQIHVAVTEKARVYRKTYDWLNEKMNESFYQGLSDDEVATFENNLMHIKNNLENVLK
jgi:DNA-binding MarR family transcriptional regulator